MATTFVMTDAWLTRRACQLPCTWCQSSNQRVNLPPAVGIRGRFTKSPTASLQNCDICQITSNNILPSRVFWESNKTRIAALISVIYTVNIRAVPPSWALKEFCRFIQPSSNDVTSWKIALGGATFLKACIVYIMTSILCYVMILAKQPINVLKIDNT